MDALLTLARDWGPLHTAVVAMFFMACGGGWIVAIIVWRALNRRTEQAFDTINKNTEALAAFRLLMEARR